MFPNQHTGNRVAPLRGQPLSDHIGHWPTDHYRSYTKPPLFGWTPPTNPNQPQIPFLTPFSDQRNASATNTLSLNAQGSMGFTFSPSPPPVAFNEVPLFPQPLLR